MAEPDEQILSLFREWIVAQIEAQDLSERATADHTPQQAAFDAAVNRIVELVDAIADIPSLGPVGLAIKAYLRHHAAHGGAYGSRPETLGEFPFDADCADARIEPSIIADAVRFAPESARSPRPHSDPPRKRPPDGAPGLLASPDGYCGLGENPTISARFSIARPIGRPIVSVTADRLPVGAEQLLEVDAGDLTKFRDQVQR